MLTVICPVYNEAENIRNLLEALMNSSSLPMEVLLVYDTEQDTTIPVVKNIFRQFPFEIKLIKNQFGRGALNAIKTGFISASGEAALVVMADLSDDFSVIENMYSLITREGYDIVCGSRYMKGGHHIGGPRLKKFFSGFIGVSLHFLAGIPVHDVTNSYKMYRTSFLRSIDTKSHGGFEIGMELVVKGFSKGSNITEVPSTWNDRTAGKSHFRIWRWGPDYFRWYVYALTHRKRAAKKEHEK
jgi:dolichol-phosphate mannosyltransferase